MPRGGWRPAPERPLVALAVIAGVEGLALCIYAIFDVVEAIRVGATGPSDVSNGPAILLQIVILAIFGIGLLAVAWGWWTSRRWARGPFILAQLFALVVGIPLAGSQGSIERWSGVALTAMAIVGIVVAMTPMVTRAVSADD